MWIREDETKFCYRILAYQIWRIYTDNFVSSHLARFHSIMVHAIWPKEAVKRSSTKVRKLHEVMCKTKSLLQSSGVVGESWRFVL